MKETFISKLSWGFAKKYRITLLFWIIILIFGALSYTTFLRREGFPSVALPAAMVQGTYFADDAKKVDTDVVQPIAGVLNDLDSVESYQAVSGDNYFNLFVTFTDETSAEDGAREIEKAIRDDAALPEEIKNTVSPINPSKFNNQHDLLLAVYDAKDSDYAQLTKEATKVASELASLDAVESAEALPVLQTTKTGSGQEVTRQTAINRIGIRENGNMEFYPAVSVGVVRGDNVDDVELLNVINNTLGDLRDNPDLEGVKTIVTADAASQINEQIDSLQGSLIGGLVAVVIVTLLLISWRAALVVALFIPTVLAATFMGLGVVGFTINTITLFAVILTLGLFVDDATIIVEAIDAHRRDRQKHKEIIKQAVARVGMASVAGTLTTMIVFGPMLLVSGVIGDFIRLMPITVILALGVSLVISLILVPFLARPLVLSGRKRAGLLDKLSVLEPVERWLGTALSRLPLLNRDQKKKGRIVTTLMVAISVAAMVGAGVFAGKLSLDIFPASRDGNILQATVEFKDGTSIEDAKRLTKELDERIESTLGNELVSASYVQADQRSAQIELDLTHYNTRDITSPELIEKLEATGETLSDGSTVTYAQEGAGPPSSDFPFQMHVYANDEEKLQKATSEIAAFIDGKTLQVDNSEVSVEEVTKDSNVTVSRSERGTFAALQARFDNVDLNSSAVIELERMVTDEFDADRLEELGLTTEALDFDVSQESENADSFSTMGIGLVVAIALMYVLLVVLYNSFLQPLLIFMAIPFSLFGVFFGLWATGYSLSFFVMLGLMGLIGIAVNNTILLTEYANQERAAGYDRHEAISRSIKDRFRPLVTTTLTTLFALLPLALNDPFWQPLAYTLIFGMISSTILIILSFPYYYLLTERIRDWKNHVFPMLK